MIMKSRKSRKRKEYLRHIIRLSLLRGNPRDYKITDIKDIIDDFYYWSARDALKILNNGRDLIAEQMRMTISILETITNTAHI